MRDSNVFVGLDYHNSGVQLCVMDGGGAVLANSAAANDWRAIVDRVGTDRTVQAALEACTGTADLAEQLVRGAGWSVSLAHPKYVAKLKGSPDKSDYSDARLLADLTRVGYLPRVWLAPAEIRELRRLVQHRRQLVDRRRSLKQRLGGLLRDHRVDTGPGPRWNVPWRSKLKTLELPEHSRWIVHEQLAEIEHLDERIDAAERRLIAATAQDPVVQRLQEFPGVGPITACALRASIGRFDRFATGKQLARYCGLSPRNASSGTRVADAGLIRDADGYLRSLLIELSWRLIRSKKEPRWPAMARRLGDRGKPRAVIVVAVANRWVRWLYHQMKTVQG